MQSLVSIIIPCFNTEKYIGEAIDSVLNQTYKNIEVLVVNDGSTDHSEEIIKSYLEKDKRVKYIFQDNNGVSSARNKGLENADGEIISFLDADDIWEKNNLEEKVGFIQSDPSTHWVFSDCYLADERMNKLRISESGNDENVFDSLITRSGDVIHAPSNVVVKKECILLNKIRFDTRLSTSADWDFCIQLALHGFIGKRIPKPLWSYRLLPESMSRNIHRMEHDNLMIYKKYADKKIFHSFWFRLKCLSNNYFILGGCWWVDGKNKTRGLYFILKSVLIYPPNILKILSKISPYYLTTPGDNEYPSPIQRETLIRLRKKKKQLVSSHAQISEPINIFLFHRINPQADPLWNPVHPKSFEKILLYLKNKFEVILLEEFLLHPYSTANKKPFCAITFDDGYRDYLEYALPLLTKYKCPASMYIVTECINQNLPPWTYQMNHSFINTSFLSLDLDTTSFPEKLKKTKWSHKAERLAYAKELSPFLKSIPDYQRRRIYNEIKNQFHDAEPPKGLMLNWKEINELWHNNTTIGSHSSTHPVLSQIMDNAELFSELQSSADEIEKHTGKIPISVAYPFGLYNTNTKDLTAKSGYKFAVTTVPYPYSNPLFDSFEIPRLELFDESLLKSKLRINGIAPKIAKFRNLLSP